MALCVESTAVDWPYRSTRAITSSALWSALGAALGYLTWGDDGSLLWLLLLPAAFGRAGSRSAVYALLLGYYLAGARGLPAGAAVFFGEAAPWWNGWALWLAASLVLALPYGLLWSEATSRRAVGFVLAMVAVAVPPFGFIGWCNPLAVAGTLFPGMCWIGLLAAAGVMAWISVLRFSVWQLTPAVLAVGLVGAIYNVEAQIALPAAPNHWRGMDTEFSRLASGGEGDAGQLLAAMQRIQWVKDLAATIPAGTTVVLPETLLGPFGGLAEFQLAKAESALAARGSRILVGAEIPQVDGRYINGLVVLGAKAGTARVIIKQGIPVPVSMWRPFSGGGAVADLWGHGAVVDLDQVRIAGLICYEQLLPWPIFQRAAARPSLLLAVSNVWWARNTSIPAVQRQTVYSFARLFGLPVVSARNT